MDFNVFTFPLEQIGWILRWLSLSGAVGNIAAITIYLLIGAIPCGMFCILKKRGKFCQMDYMLIFLSIMLFAVLYYMINPGLLQRPTPEGGKVLLCGSFYSVLTGYLVLRMINGNKKTDLVSLQGALRVVLYIVMMLFVLSALIECFVNLPANLQNVTEGNSAAVDNFFYGAPDLTMTYVFLVLQCVVNALPYGLSAVIVFWCIKALEELLKDSYSEKAVMMIKKIVLLCRKFLIIVVVLGMMFNLAQLIFSNQLYQMHISVNIPVFAILLLLVIHVLARYIEENQKLKEDNSLFI